MGGSIVEHDPTADHAAAAAASAAAAAMHRVLTTRHHGQDITCSGVGITAQDQSKTRIRHHPNLPELTAPLSTSSYTGIARRDPVAEIFPPFSLEEHKAKYEQASERARR